jgi:hypothetical protein
MVVTPDPRTPYHEEPNTAPPRSMTDFAAAFWVVAAAALAAFVLIWLITATSIRIPDSVDPNAKPAVETQPVTPPAPVPATRQAPTP